MPVAAGEKPRFLSAFGDAPDPRRLGLSFCRCGGSDSEQQDVIEDETIGRFRLALIADQIPVRSEPGHHSEVYLASVPITIRPVVR